MNRLNLMRTSRFLDRFGSALILRSCSRFSSKPINDNDAYIISAARTPIGCFRSKLSQFTAPQLGTVAVKAAVQRSGLSSDVFEEAVMGNVIQAMIGQNPARQTVLASGLSNSVASTTINKACASGMKAYMFLSQAIHCGHIDYAIAGGQESLSNAPFYIRRGEIPYGGTQIIDGLTYDLTDPIHRVLMGTLAEKTAESMNISREEQDEFAMNSYRRSAEHAAKITKLEIVPVDVPATKKTPAHQITEDEEYKKVNFDRFQSLPPAFKKENGTITAGNASKINDGASAAVLTSGRAVKKHGLKPLARIVAYADAALEPVDFTIAPASAIKKILEKTGKTIEDISMWEFNEAFSVVVLANIKLLKLDPSKVNMFGGAVSIGHPVGMSGSRITNLLALHLQPGQLGIASICNALGGASAIMVEKCE